MPDFRLELWNESRLDLDTPYVRMAYEARKFAFVADYVRLSTLYQFGGIYLDTDVEALRSLDDLRRESLFLGYERPNVVGVSVIGAQARHPFLKAVLDRLDEEAKTGRLSFRPLPDVVTEVLAAHDKDLPRIFPEAYFYPYNPYSPEMLRRKPLQSSITGETRCIHHWEGTWLEGVTLRELILTRVRELLRRMRARPA